MMRKPEIPLENVVKELSFKPDHEELEPWESGNPGKKSDPRERFCRHIENERSEGASTRDSTGRLKGHA